MECKTCGQQPSDNYGFRYGRKGTLRGPNGDLVSDVVVGTKEVALCRRSIRTAYFYPQIRLAVVLLATWVLLAGFAYLVGIERTVGTIALAIGGLSAFGLAVPFLRSVNLLFAGLKQRGEKLAIHSARNELEADGFTGFWTSQDVLLTFPNASPVEPK